MENNIVLADEMHQFGFIVFPPGFPVHLFLASCCAERFVFLICPFAGGRNVADGCIKPHIQDFAFGIIQWDFHAPVEVAGNGAGMQALINPGFALPVNIGFPIVFMTLQYPVGEPAGVIIQGQEPVFGFFQNRLVPTQH